VNELVLTAGQLIGPARVRIYRLEGACRGSAQPLLALYAGNEANRHFLQTILFEHATATLQAELPNPIGLPRYVRQAAASTDVVVTDLPPAWSLLAGAAQIRIPAWVRQQISLSANGPLLSAKIERQTKRLARLGYTVEFTDAVPDGEVFYEQLYAPYIAARFGAGAYVVPRERFLRRLAGNTLAKLCDDGRWIAGTLLYQERDSLRLGWFGCRSCPPPRGASLILDTECIRHARSRGASRVVLGSSRPSLTDGATSYKTRLGAGIVSTRLPSQALSICVRTWTDALARCLNDRALVRVRGRAPAVYRVACDARKQVVTLETLPPFGIADT
jgi:hypothetical protein